MKKILSITLLLLATLSLYAQTDGISYQAVIIDPNPKELPGVDAEGNILPNATIAIRFTILDSNNAEEYQEVQTTKTDQFGMINLMIGQGVPTGAGTGDFTLISWDGDPKSLQVEIDFEGTGNSFVDMNRQELTFVPYAYHRDITATGTLTVDDVTDLNGELRVHGPTNLNSSLDVNNDNATNLTGTLTVGAATELNDRLTVNGITNINDSLNINNQSPTFFSGDITVAAEGTATFDGPTAFNAPAEFVEMTVNGPSNLNGQVTIRAVRENVDSTFSQSDYDAYPLIVEGSKQGIAIKVSEDRTSNNNYISFWDSNQMWGRIEGQSRLDLELDYQIERKRIKNGLDIAKAITQVAVGFAEVGQSTVKLAASFTSSTACVGIGACVTAPIPSLIIESSTNTIVKIANWVILGYDLVSAIEEEINFEASIHANLGVTYSSGSGDYAEWLPKQNLSETFTEGELVGVKNGFVTKNTWGVEKIMIVSTRPIVLGNMPQLNNERDNVKIAFMGQVPTKVFGDVSPGDYILPSELGNGFGKAVHPDDMNTRDYKKIAGVAWSVISEIVEGVSIVNVAVGINTNDLSGVVYRQEEKLKNLQEDYKKLKLQIEQSNAALKNLVPGYAEAIGINNTSDSQNANYVLNSVDNSVDEQDIVHSDEDDVLYFEISKEQIEASLEIARDIYQDMLDNDDQINKLFFSKKNTPSSEPENILSHESYPQFENIPHVPVKDHPFWQKIDSDPEYKDEIIQFVLSNMEKAMHTHKKYSHNFTNIKLKE